MEKWRSRKNREVVSTLGYLVDQIGTIELCGGIETSSNELTIAALILGFVYALSTSLEKGLEKFATGIGIAQAHADRARKQCLRAAHSLMATDENTAVKTLQIFHDFVAKKWSGGIQEATVAAGLLRVGSALCESVYYLILLILLFKRCVLTT